MTGAWVFFLGFSFGGTPFFVLFLEAPFFFAMTFGGSVSFGFFFGGIIFSGLDVSSVSVVIPNSVESVTVGMVLAEEGAAVIFVGTAVVGALVRF